MSRTVSEVSTDMNALNAMQILTFNSKAKNLVSGDDGHHFAIVVDDDSNVPMPPGTPDPDALAQEIYDDHFDTEEHWFDLSDEINGGTYEVLLYSHPRKRFE